MPADAFTGATQLVEKAICDDYMELAGASLNWQVRAEPAAAPARRVKALSSIGSDHRTADPCGR